MKHENAHQYADYIDGDGIQALYSGVNKYVTHKQYYDTSYGDIVPFIMSNAICIHFMIIIQLADSYRVQLVECVENNRPTIILLKSGEHYDAIMPNVHNTPIYSALPVNRTEMTYNYKKCEKCMIRVAFKITASMCWRLFRHLAVMCLMLTLIPMIFYHYQIQI